MSTKELNAFLAWAEENEIVWDRDAIDIRDGKNGLGVFAKRKLEAGYEAIKVPKHAILSVETTAIANILQDEEIEGYIGLTLGCMYEASRGAESPWFAYLSLLAKRPANMATSLPQNARDMMKSCEAYNDIESDITDMREDYDNIVVPLTKKYPEIFKTPHFDFEAFQAMTAHVSSRAMDVDHFHVSALVPFADFVNHSPEPNGDYLTHEDVCEVCGSLACEHLEGEDDDEEDSDDEDSDDESDLDPEEAPVLDGSKDRRKRREAKEANEGEEDEEEEEEDDEAMEGEEWEDEGDDEDSDDEDGMINDTCDIILDTDVRKGEEITRFYGPYPNKVLLSKYGFAVIDNPHDTVTIQLDMVRQVGEKVLKNKEVVEERIQWFLEVEDEFIGADHGDEGEGGCCGGGDHEHDHGHGHGHHHGHKHGSSDGEDDHEHDGDGSCCGDKDTKKKQKTHSFEDENEDAEDMEQDEEEEEEEEDEEEDFPRDIMYMMADGTVDDRLFMLLNVLFMEKAMFAKVKEDAEIAGEYMNDIFRRRSKEEQGGDEEEEVEEEEEEEALPPRDKTQTKTRRAVLEAIQALIRVRADAFGVSTKTSAEKDLEALKKAKLSGPLYYGGICVQGEKQILQNALMVCQHFLSEL